MLSTATTPISRLHNMRDPETNGSITQQGSTDINNQRKLAATLLPEPRVSITHSHCTNEVAAVLNVNVVDIVQINVIKVHAPQQLPGKVHGVPWLPRLLDDRHDLLQALPRGVHVCQLHALLVLVGHLDGQVLEEPRVVLDLRNGYSLWRGKL